MRRRLRLRAPAAALTSHACDGALRLRRGRRGGPLFSRRLRRPATHPTTRGGSGELGGSAIQPRGAKAPRNSASRRGSAVQRRIRRRAEAPAYSAALPSSHGARRRRGTQRSQGARILICVDQSTDGASASSNRSLRLMKASKRNSTKKASTPTMTDADAGDSPDQKSGDAKVTNSNDASVSTTSRCSPRQLTAVIQALDEVKEQLVRDIGFDGLLKLPSLTSLNQQFGCYLLAKVDCDRQCLVLDEHHTIPFTANDVRLVFGIPCGPKDVLGNESQITDKGKDYIRESIGMQASNPRSLKAVHDFLLKDFGLSPTSWHKDCFKIAFVVYAVGSFLAPHAKHDYVSSAFWGALRCTTDINSFNWGAYVIKAIVESARKVQADITNRRPVNLFLQVLYLDSVFIDGLSTPHSDFPRIRAFSTDSLNAFIAHLTTPEGYLQPQLRDSKTVCYAWKDKPMKQLHASLPATSTHGFHSAELPQLLTTPAVTVGDVSISTSTTTRRATDVYNLIKDQYPDLQQREGDGRR